MIKKKILDNLKRIVIIIICIMTVVSIMPKKVDAQISGGELISGIDKKKSSKILGILADAINVILSLPDGVAHLCDVYLSGNNEPSKYAVDDGFSMSDLIDYTPEIYNISITPYKLFTSGTYKEVNDHYEVNMGIIDVNFFAEKDIQSINNKTIVASSILAPAIGNVYINLRNFGIVLMMLVLVYIGIKILISSISEEQAKYKRMLVDWVVGLCLLFFMHYIMTAILNLNSAIINLIKNEEGDSFYICSDLDLEQDAVPNTEMERERAIQFNNYGISKEIFDENNGYAINLNEGQHSSYGGQQTFGNNPTLDISKWGNKGIIKPNAFLVKDPNDDEFTVTSIYRLNTMSYVRTISNLALYDSEKLFIVGYNNINQSGVVDQMGYTILYWVLLLETVMFISIYIKRVIQLAFLTMIAPIVAFMYPLDKIGDGKAQSFNQWFKDYLFGVLIQPMHLLLYTIFIYAAGELFQNNIIYAIAIYAYMITAEKYIKKILGFEKASSGPATGMLRGALGAGLAMEGLGKLAGIGPGAHGPKTGGGKDGDKPRTHKIRKLKPSGSSGGSSASSGGGSAGGGSAGGGSAGGNPNSGGSGGTSGNGNGPNSPAPNANGSKKVGKLGAASNVLGRKINRALTGGKYTSRAPGYAKAVAGNLIGKGIRGGSKIAGKAIMGGAGLMIGTASALVNGRPDDILKGAMIGAKAGEKWFGAAGNTITNIGSGISNFADEVNFERAKTDDDVAKRLREKDTLIQYQDELADCTSEDREKYEDAIKQMSAYTDFKSFGEVKAAAEAIDIAKANNQGNDDNAILKMYDEGKKWNGMETNSAMQDTYKQFIDSEVRQNLGGGATQAAIEAEKQRRMNDIIRISNKLA